MNPLNWKREHQLAGIVICIIGAIVGLLAGWFDSPIYSEFLGPGVDSTQAFLTWLPYYQLYWPWPLFGVLIARLAFYALQLLRNSN